MSIDPLPLETIKEYLLELLRSKGSASSITQFSADFYRMGLVAKPADVRQALIELAQNNAIVPLSEGEYTLSSFASPVTSDEKFEYAPSSIILTHVKLYLNATNFQNLRNERRSKLVDYYHSEVLEVTESFVALKGNSPSYESLKNELVRYSQFLGDDPKSIDFSMLYIVGLRLERLAKEIQDEENEFYGEEILLRLLRCHEILMLSSFYGRDILAQFELVAARPSLSISNSNSYAADAALLPERAVVASDTSGLSLRNLFKSFIRYPLFPVFTSNLLSISSYLTNSYVTFLDGNRVKSRWLRRIYGQTNIDSQRSVIMTSMDVEEENTMGSSKYSSDVKAALAKELECDISEITDQLVEEKIKLSDELHLLELNNRESVLTSTKLPFANWLLSQTEQFNLDPEKWRRADAASASMVDLKE